MLLLARASLVTLWAQQVDSAYDTTVCDQKSYTSSENMIFNPNAWNPDGHGFQCMSVQDSPPAFDATWAWVNEPQSVHSYPHVKLAVHSLPVLLSNISALTLSAKWSMGPGPRPLPVLQLNSSGLDDVGATANVAFDMFADRIPIRAGNATMAETEIMIWLGRFGYAYPLGFGDGQTCFNHTLGRVVFMLYAGRNQRRTKVFTWMATTNETSFTAEISSLLQSLWRTGLVSADSHLGLVEFGSEAFHSPTNITFAAQDFSIRLVAGPPPAHEIGALPTACSRAAPVFARGQGSWLFIMSIIGIVTLVFYAL